MFNYQILNLPNFEIDETIVLKIFQIVSNHIKKDQNWTLNIVFVSSEDIKELNKNYRQKDYETDVLSFHYYNDFEKVSWNDIVWELIFCEEKIISQALEYWLWNQKEFYKLLIHSILHILWYDHEIDEEYLVMQKLEDEIWNELFEKK